ncbi:hypothetical protein V7014_25755 [Bacillus sp. JJ722]
MSKLDIDEQLKFYKEEFSFQHCELNGCGNEVHSNWVKYKGDLYCESCFEWLIQEERKEDVKKIAKLKKN